jgi:hypothetical protein
MIEIDNIISQQKQLIKDKISKNNFEILCEFSLEESDSELDEKFKSLKKVQGIYLFEIYKSELMEFGEWIFEIKKEFRKHLKVWTPNIVEKRCKFHNASKEKWIPLYIGKSSNLYRRLLKEHINSQLGAPPSSLKLKRRQTLQSQKFRVKYISLDTITNYDLIAIILENKLRDEINPIAGK